MASDPAPSSAASAPVSSRKRSPVAQRVLPGQPFPMGASWDGMGVNFSLFAAHATGVKLLLFNSPQSKAPALEIPLTERSGHIWHAYIPGLFPGQLYAFRVDGAYHPDAGHRHNPNKVLLDPYAKAIGRTVRWDDALFGYTIGHAEGDLSFDSRDSAPYAPLGMVVDEGFAWGNDTLPRIPLADTVFYETHVRGLTVQHPDVPTEQRGTYLGVASEAMIEHYKRLGVTSIQLLPVHAHLNDRRLAYAGLRNYWGYNTLSFFAPEPTYSMRGGMAAVTEFKTMVRTLHREGLEVILDVVYNHTAEGSHLGPTLSMRGIDNFSYYKSNATARRFLVDFTGTGNTLDVGNAHVLQLILDSLRYWVTEMHVDGFRFDLTAALAREHYDVSLEAAFFKAVQQDPVLSTVKLIAEPWDIGPGGYLVGAFSHPWLEWNGRYRDVVRRFWRADPGSKGEVATRIAGSSDLYNHRGRRPTSSVNFVTAHDGFTLEDLVSYEHKHNLANLEYNRDGHEPNYSVNCGVEGPTNDAQILAKRERRKRALMATLFISQGVPMLLGGDELSRTQRGNNNAYCQDNEISWFDWMLDGRKERFLIFMQELIQFRKAHPSFRREKFLTGQPDASGLEDASWWTPEGLRMQAHDWTDSSLHGFGLLLRGERLDRVDPRNGERFVDSTFLLLFNRGEVPLTFRLPDDPGIPVRWKVPRPFDELFERSPGIVRRTLTIEDKSLVVLEAC